MLTLLSTAHAGLLFAKAGQWIVEMKLIELYLDSDDIKLILEVTGEDFEFIRFEEHFRPHLDSGKLEFFRKGTVDIVELAKRADGMFVHGMGDLLAKVVRYDLMNILPVFVHLHSLELNYEQRMCYKLPWYIWNKQHPALFISPSETTKRRIRSLSNPDKESKGAFPKVEVVPHGIDVGSLVNGNGSNLREQLEIDLEAKVILSFNRISMQKFDYLQLILVFNQVLLEIGDRENVVLLIAGSASHEDREMAEQLKDFVSEIDLNKKVKFLIDVDENEKKDVYAAADVYVSLACNPQESFGIALLEAMVAGLPVVATDWNGYGEVLSEPYEHLLIPTIASHELAWKVDAFNDLPDLTTAAAPFSDHVVDLIVRMITDVQLALSLTDKGRQRATQFTWEKTGDILMDLWRGISQNGVGFKTETEDAQLPVIHSPVDGLATYYLSPSSRLKLCFSYDLGMIDAMLNVFGNSSDNELSMVVATVDQLRDGPKPLSEISILRNITYPELFRIVLLMIRRGLITLDLN